MVLPARDPLGDRAIFILPDCRSNTPRSAIILAFAIIQNTVYLTILENIIRPIERNVILTTCHPVDEFIRKSDDILHRLDCS